MAIFKKSKVKSVSKQFTRVTLDSIGPPNSNMMETFITWLKDLKEKDLKSSDADSFFMKISKFPSWDSALVATMWSFVVKELSNIPSIDTDKNFQICYDCVHKEIDRWIKKHGYFPEQINDTPTPDPPKPDTNIKDEMVDAVFNSDTENDTVEAVYSEVERTIISCSKCSKKLRVPSNKTIRVKCPECGHAFIGTFN